MVLSVMEEKNKMRPVNEMMVQGLECIVDVKDFRSLGCWLTNTVSCYLSL